jgi:hypothetical protein
MIYLQAFEYENYGVEATTPAACAAAASALVEAHCRRSTLGVAQYTERLRVVLGRNTVRVTYLPLAAGPASSPLVSVRARYGMPRRGDGIAPAGYDQGYVQEVVRAFSLAGTWVSLAPAEIDVCADTGELTLPANSLGVGFNEIEVTYNAGLAEIPDAVKVACAQIMRNALATPALNLRTGTLDRMHLEYFSDTLLDANVRALLAPYVAQKVG